jgi:hypothetical protein
MMPEKSLVIYWADNGRNTTTISVKNGKLLWIIRYLLFVDYEVAAGAEGR